MGRLEALRAKTKGGVGYSTTEYTENTERGWWLLAAGDAKAAERRSKSFRALRCLPKAVSVCSVAKRRKGTLLGSGGAQEGGGWKPYHVGVQSAAFSVCSRPVLRLAHAAALPCASRRSMVRTTGGWDAHETVLW